MNLLTKGELINRHRGRQGEVNENQQFRSSTQTVEIRVIFFFTFSYNFQFLSFFGLVVHPMSQSPTLVLLLYHSLIVLPLFSTTLPLYTSTFVCVTCQVAVALKVISFLASMATPCYKCLLIIHIGCP